MASSIKHILFSKRYSDISIKLDDLSPRHGKVMGSMLGRVTVVLVSDAKMRGLVPCCGQDGYRAQVPQHPIDSYRYIAHTYQPIM